MGCLIASVSLLFYYIDDMMFIGAFIAGNVYTPLDNAGKFRMGGYDNDGRISKQAFLVDTSLPIFTSRKLRSLTDTVFVWCSLSNLYHRRIRSILDSYQRSTSVLDRRLFSSPWDGLPHCQCFVAILLHRRHDVHWSFYCWKRIYSP